MDNAVNIYQIFTRLFRNDDGKNIPYGTIEENGCSKFNHLTDKALNVLKEFGITHIWFTGVIRHATCTNYESIGLPANNPKIVKGSAGSPYAITDYYDVDPDLAIEPKNRMKEFENLVTRCHENNLKVIIDFVPNHVARQYKSKNQPKDIQQIGENDDSDFCFLPENNFYYLPNQAFIVPLGTSLPYSSESKEYHEFPAKVTGNDAFTPTPSINDWYETVKLNYGVDYLNNRQEHFDPIPDTWIKMEHILTYWANKGIDGIRCDMAEMVPVQFWQWVIPRIKLVNESIIFIAEVYKPHEYKTFLDAGFDYLYDKVGLYDILRGLIEGYGSSREITNLWQRYEGFSHRMLRFLENHDEQRIASKQFAGNPWKAVPALVLATTLHRGPFMLYFGQEIGEEAHDSEGFSGHDGRTTIFDYWRVKDYQNWVNGGKFTNEHLSYDQINLRNFYRSLNHLRLTSKAISHGGFYDLMWVNQHLNLDKVFAYLRHYNGEVILVLLNFDHCNDYNLKLRFPNDAIINMGLSMVDSWNARETITGNQTTLFHPNDAQDQGIPILIRTNSAHVYFVK